MPGKVPKAGVTTERAGWRIELLGGLRARQADRVLTRFRTRQTGVLLAYLALYLGRSHPRERLTELLWPDADTDPRHQLRNALTALRRQLEPPGTPPGSVLLAGRAAVQLNPAAVTTDVGDFEAALATARQARSAMERQQRLSEAVALYGGELLPGSFENWILTERQRLEEAYLEALAGLAREAEAAGEFGRALEWARRAVAADPPREEGQRELIRLLVRAGEPEAARRQYADFARLVAQELNAEPEPDTQALLREAERRDARVVHGEAKTRSEDAAGEAGVETGPVAPQISTSNSAPTRSPHGPGGTVTFLLMEVGAASAAAAGANDPALAAEGRDALLREVRRHSGQAVQIGNESVLAVFERASDAAAAAVAGMERVFRAAYSVSGERPEDVFRSSCFGSDEQPKGSGRAARPASNEAPKGTSDERPDTRYGIQNTPRMALHTGELEVDTTEEYRGPAMQHVLRLLLAAHPGQIVCSEATATLLRADGEPGKRSYPLVDLGVYRLRDATSGTMRERLFHLPGASALRRQFPPPQGTLPLASDLPLQFTRFFGREAEIDALVRLLGGDHRRDAEDAEAEMATDDACSSCSSLRALRLGGDIDSSRSAGPRLVTLTGPGGSGKTRLALEVAARLVEPFAGAVWFVPLADLTEAERIPEAARDAMRLPRTSPLQPLEQVVQALLRGADSQLSLLVLDNFEHLVAEGAAVVQTLRERVPALTLLITSRQVLGLEGEQEFPVAPLPAPDARHQTPDARTNRDEAASSPDLASDVWRLASIPSVQLFVDRAQAAQPDFQLTGANVWMVAALCGKLEGLPLAIELAAARAGTLSPRDMLEQLEDRFQFLVSRKRNVIPRHRSLRAALDWSYHLLSPELQRCLARLSGFRGGFTLGAASAILDFGRGSEIQALEALEQLRDCSLVLSESPTPGPPETDRQAQGCSKLINRTVIDPLRLTHGEAEIRFRLLETVREYAAEQLTAEEAAVLAARHAHYFLALAEEAEPKLTGPGQSVWLDRLEREHANLHEAIHWSVRGGYADVGTRLGAALAPFWRTRGYVAAGRECLTQVLALAPAARTAARARALDGAAMLAHYQGDFAATRSLLEQSAATARAIGDPSALATALASLGLTLRVQGDYPAAASVLAESLAVAREQGDPGRIGVVLGLLGDVALHQGHFAAARSCYEASLAPRQEAGDKRRIAYHFNNMGDVTGAQGEYPQAHSFYAEGLRGCRDLDDTPGVAWSLYGLSSVALHQGELQAARAYGAESLARRHQLGDKRGVAECLERLAAVDAMEERAPQAAILFGAAAALRRAIGAPLPPASRVDHDRRVAALRETLGDEVFMAAWAEGRALPLAQAVAAALSGPPDRSAAPGRSPGRPRRGRKPQA